MHISQGGQSRDTQLVSHIFVHGFASIEGMSNDFSWGFRPISEKTLGADTPALQRIILSLTDFNVNV